jgi:hypothetical protein
MAYKLLITNAVQIPAAEVGCKCHACLDLGSLQKPRQSVQAAQILSVISDERQIRQRNPSFDITLTRSDPGDDHSEARKLYSLATPKA